MGKIRLKILFDCREDWRLPAGPLSPSSSSVNIAGKQKSFKEKGNEVYFVRIELLSQRIKFLIF
jgi:hypothetical protein